MIDGIPVTGHYYDDPQGLPDLGLQQSPRCSILMESLYLHLPQKWATNNGKYSKEHLGSPKLSQSAGEEICQETQWKKCGVWAVDTALLPPGLGASWVPNSISCDQQPLMGWNPKMGRQILKTAHVSLNYLSTLVIFHRAMWVYPGSLFSVPKSLHTKLTTIHQYPSVPITFQRIFCSWSSTAPSASDLLVSSRLPECSTQHSSINRFQSLMFHDLFVWKVTSSYIFHCDL